MRHFPALAVLLAATACANIDAPVVQAAPLRDTRDTLGPYRVGAVVDENRTLTAVRLYHRPEGSAQAAVVELTEVAAGRFEGDMPGYGAGAVVHWFVEAEDADGNLGYSPEGAELGDGACVTSLSVCDGTLPCESGTCLGGVCVDGDTGAAWCFTVLK